MEDLVFGVDRRPEVFQSWSVHWADPVNETWVSILSIKRIVNYAAVDVKDLEAAILEQFVKDHCFVGNGIPYSDGWIKWIWCNDVMCAVTRVILVYIPWMTTISLNNSWCWSWSRWCRFSCRWYRSRFRRSRYICDYLRGTLLWHLRRRGWQWDTK